MEPGKWISEKLRPAAELARPTYAAPALACDCHMHIFGPAEKYAGIADARYTLPEGRLDQYRTMADIFGLQRAVFVQPSYYGTDNSCLLDAMAAFGRPCRGVVFLPEVTTPALMADFHRRGVRGMRLDFFKTEQAGASHSEVVRQLKEAARIARDAGWHIELYSPGRTVRDLIDDLAALDIAFSINHMGYMKSEDGLTEADFARFLELARSPHCWVKLTGPYRVAPGGDQSRPNAMARALVETAPERLLWGSDWPHLPHGSRDTGELFNRLALWCPDEAIRRDIFVRNPSRLYQFD